MHKTRQSVESDAMTRLLPSRQKVAHVLRREDMEIIKITVLRDGPVLHTPRDSGITAGLDSSPQQCIMPRETACEAVMSQSGSPENQPQARWAEDH